MPPTPNVTLVGTFSDLQGNLISSGTVTAVLAGYGSDIPKVSGAVLDVTTVSATVTNGTFSLSLYGNDQITPLSTYYQITVPYPMGNGTAGGTTTKPYRITGGGSFDLSTLNPLSSQIVVNTPANSATPVVFSPIAHQFITGMNSQGQFSSAQPAASDLSDGTTGSGAVVRATSPTLTTPTITNGTISAASGTAVSWNSDTGISRSAASTIALGNATQGDASGTLKLAILNVGGDVGLSRTSLGTLAIGNASQGDTTGNLLLNRIVQYFGVLTAGIGIAPIYSIVTSTAQTASIGTTTLYAVPVGGAGLYRVSYSLVTTTGGTGGTAGLTINWNNGSNTASLGSGTITLQTLGAEVTSTLLLESGASQNITYSTTVSGATGNPQYSLRIRLEYLG